MIKSRSPHYKEIPYLSPSSMDEPSGFYVDLYVWNGNKASVPAEATYRLKVSNPLGLVGNAKVNISEYVNDYFYDLLPTVTDTTEIVDGVSCWVKSEVIYIIDDVEQSAEFDVTELAIYGYGGGYEGINPTTPDNDVLCQGSEVKVYKDGFFTLPFLADESEDVELRLLSENIDTTIIQGSTTNPLAKVLFINCSEFPNDSFIEIYKDKVLVYTILLTNECRYTPLDITYINKDGQLSTLTFFKEKIDSERTTVEQFERSYNQPSSGYHQMVDYNKNSKKTFTINSGFIDEDNNQLFSDLLKSESIWILENGSLNPINVNTSILEYKSRQKDRLINYRLEFGYSYYEINNL